MKNFFNYFLLLSGFGIIASVILFIEFDGDDIYLATVLLPPAFYLWKNNFFKRNN